MAVEPSRPCGARVGAPRSSASRPALLAALLGVWLAVLPLSPARAWAEPAGPAEGAPAAVSPAAAPGDSIRLRARLRPPGADRGDVARTGDLYRVHASVLPPPGTLLASFAADLYGVDYFEPGRAARRGTFQDLTFALAYAPIAGVWLHAAIPKRSWSGELLPPSGGGWGDARLGATCALPSPWGPLAWSVWAGTTVATGKIATGTGEGKAAPEAGAGATLRLWRAGRYPELRVHLNAGWRRNPDAGRGGGPASFTPWPPLYPAVPPGGSPADNDFLLLGGGLEFRRDNVSLFVEYTEARLPLRSGAAVKEDQRCLTPGLHWGAAKGWGISVAYDVSLSLDDPQTAFVPAYPDLVYHIEISHGLGIGAIAGGAGRR